MNKLISIVLITILALALVTGCQKTVEEDSEVKTEVEEKQDFESSGDPKQDFQNLISLKNNAEFEVDYKLSVESNVQTKTGGSIKQSISGNQIIAQKEGKVRKTLSQTINGQFIVSNVYVLPTKTITCSNSLGDVRCFKGEQAQDIHENQKTSDEIEAGLADYKKVKAVADQTIAGEDAKCFTVYAGDVAYDDIIMTECITSDGIPVSIRVARFDKTYVYSLEAKSVSRNVNDAQFNLPLEADNIR